MVNAKIAQKIEQGLGRSTRGKSDYCAVLITENDLVAFVRSKQNRRHLSPGTNAQLELGLAITNEIKKSEEEAKYRSALIQEINRCLSRDEGWKGFYRSSIEAARDSAGSRPEYKASLQITATENTAAALFLRRNYEGAAVEIQTLLSNHALSDQEKGWFLQLAATYLYGSDKSKAMSMQRKAYELNSYLFVPPEGIRYHRMAEQNE